MIYATSVETLLCLRAVVPGSCLLPGTIPSSQLSQPYLQERRHGAFSRDVFHCRFELVLMRTYE